MTKKVANMIIEDGIVNLFDISKQGKTLSDSDVEAALDSALLVVKITSGHANKLYNNQVFPPETFDKALPSWIGQPVLDADHYSTSVIGVITAAKLETTGKPEDLSGSYHDGQGGTHREVLWAAIHDADAAKKIVSKRYRKVSAGRAPSHKDASHCSICGSPSIGRMCCSGTNNGDSEQRHWYGDTYTVDGSDRIAHTIHDSVTNVHLAFIAGGHSADRNSEVTEIVENNLKDSSVNNLFSDVQAFALYKDGTLKDIETGSTVNVDASILDSFGPHTNFPDDVLPSIYPYNDSGSKLSKDSFEVIKSLLGKNPTSNSQRLKLPDNAFVGPNRTFQANSASTVQAGLFLLRSEDSCMESIPDSVRDDIYFELRARESLFPEISRVRESSLDDASFETAACIYRLNRANCLNLDLEGGALNEECYNTLLSEIRNDKLTDRQVSRLRGFTGIQSLSACFLCDTEDSKAASKKAIESGWYVGPIPKTNILKSLGLSDSGITQTEEVSSMSFKQLLDSLNEVDAGSIAILLDAPKVKEAIDTKVSKALEPKESEIKELKDANNSLVDLVKDNLVSNILSSKEKLNLIPATALDKDSDERKAIITALKEKSLEVLGELRDSFAELVKDIVKDETNTDSSETDTTEDNNSTHVEETNTETDKNAPKGIRISDV